MFNMDYMREQVFRMSDPNDPYTEEDFNKEFMGIGNSKATKQDVKSNFVSVANELYRVMKDDSNLVFFCTVEWMFKNFSEITKIGF